VWPHLTVASPWSELVANGAWISLYMVWLSLLLAGVFGAGRGLPIAGQGITTTAAKQTAVTVLLVAGSLGVLAVVVAVLVTWHWQG
jgi:cytochrome b561